MAQFCNICKATVIRRSMQFSCENKSSLLPQPGKRNRMLQVLRLPAIILSKDATPRADFFFWRLTKKTDLNRHLQLGIYTKSGESFYYLNCFILNCCVYQLIFFFGLASLVSLSLERIAPSLYLEPIRCQLLVHQLCWRLRHLDKTK